MVLAETNQTFDELINVDDSDSKFIDIFKTVFCPLDKLEYMSKEHMIQLNKPNDILMYYAEEFSQEILDVFNKEFNANYSNATDIIDYMKNHSDLFNDVWKQSAGNYDVEVLHNTIHDLKDKDDSIGEQTKLPPDSAVIDVDSRDAAFAYINGEILIGEGKKTHGQLINDFFNSTGDSFYRDDAIDTINNNDKNAAFSCGHIIDNVAIIDSTENCTQQDVANALLDYDSSICKVYFCPDESTLTRIAKKIIINKGK